jgi:uncharacterized protein YciI
MEFFCYHRDRAGSTPIRAEMVEEHWSYMDRFELIARGPTFLDDDTLTGSVHVVDLPDAAAARAFVFEEPCYQAGAYRDVLLRRWHPSPGRTTWDFGASRPDRSRYLVLGFTWEPAAEADDLPAREEVIGSGLLKSDGGALVLGAAVLTEASDAERARSVLSPDRFTGIEVHRWRVGGRPA